MILMKKLPFFIFFACFLFLPAFGAKQAEARQTDSPTVIEIGVKNSEDVLSRFYVKGLTPANTNVLVYINGTYTREADVSSQKTDSDSFYYENSEILPGDSCWIKLIAQDKTSLVLSAPVEMEYFFPPLPAPTLIGPSKKDILGSPKPKIIGLSASQSFVHIYVDGIYNGRTEFLSHKSGTANFSYKPFLNLKPGWHRVQAVAEDNKGGKSKISEVLEFRIEEPMPAPTLFAPVISGGNSSQPFIVGLAKNNSFIKIYIDHKLTGRFLVKNHKSGTANFAHKPVEPLARGNHLVYATAVDSRGKESQWSNIVYFSARQPIIADSAKEENIKIPEGGSGKGLGEEGEVPLVISPNGDVQADVAGSGKDAKKIDEPENKIKTVYSGSINEGRKKQNKISLNLIVFIVFLLGIMGWIIWVNRELAKEKKAQGQKKIFQEASADAPTEVKAMADRQGENKEDDDSQIKKD